MSAGIVALAPVGMAAAGVLVGAASAWRPPAERQLNARPALAGALGIGATAVLAVVLPPIAFHAPALVGLLAAGTVAGAVAGGLVRLRPGPLGIMARGGRWHLLPASLALLSLQAAALADSLDGVVFATAAVVACAALALAATSVVTLRCVTLRHRSSPPVQGPATATGPPPAPHDQVPVTGPALAAPQPGEPGRRRGRAAPAVAVLVAALALLGLGFVLGQGSRTATDPVAGPSVPVSQPPSPTVEPAPGGESSQSPTTDPATVAPSPTRQDASSDTGYVGLVYASGETPTGITELGGALIPGTDHATSWMSGPEGDMFWLLREAGTDPDGSVSAWEVRDVVVWPRVTEDSAQVVSGAVRCLVDGAEVVGVVAVFPLVDDEWFVDPYAAWWPDTDSDLLVPLPDTTTCVNEAYGV